MGSLGLLAAWMPAGLENCQLGAFFVLADFDGNGRLDVYAAGSGRPDVLFLQSGSQPGTFQEAVAHLPAAANGGKRALFRDFDGDGDLDGILSRYAYPSQDPSLYLENTGKGVFVDSTSARLGFQLIGPEGVFLDAADLDGDGAPDLLAMAGFYPSQAQVFWNDGKGSFSGSRRTILPSGPGLPAGVSASRGVCADFTGAGGRPDILLLPPPRSSSASVVRQPLRLWENWGGGSFLEVTGSALETAYAYAYGPPLALDLDGDGLPEVAMDGRLYRNLGGFRFIEITDQYVPSPPLWGKWWGKLLDLDLDGDLDLVNWESFFGYVPLRVFLNLHRQVATGGSWGLGKSGHVEVYGHQGDTALLFASSGRHPLGLPGLGSWWLDTKGLVGLEAGVLPQSGARATGLLDRRVAVPNDPALAGGELWFQALLFRPGRGFLLTGADRARVTGF